MIKLRQISKPAKVIVLKKKGRRYVKKLFQNRFQTKWLYTNRASGGDRNNSDINGDIDARAAARQETSQYRRLQIQPASMGCDLAHVYTG
jgi:hypothetical protein